MSDSVRPHRRQPTRLPRPWDYPGKNTGVGCHFLLQCMKVKSEREVNQSCPTLATPWTAAHQAPPSMGFPRQEYWSRLPFPTPGDLPNPGIEPTVLTFPALAGRLFTTTVTWEALLLLLLSCFSRVQLCVIQETAAHQAPPSLGFSRQEHWSGLPFPSPMHESKK